MGGRFDSDAKRWRFRASLLFAAGNGMEIATYIFPQLFLILATTANCCKQMSMLTSSSTRTSIYNSFRDGTRENIGDIVAKGEASIAIVDLLGIATGVTVSRTLGTSVRSVLSIYIGLQTLEIFCLYCMLRTVQYKVFNFERLVNALNDFIGSDLERVNDDGKMVVNGETKYQSTLKTPEEMARQEKIILPPAHLSRRVFAFGSLGRAKLDPDEIIELLSIFEGEKYMLVVGKNLKAPRKSHSSRILHHFNNAKNEVALDMQEHCHIVLHVEATTADIMKSTLALMLLRRKLGGLTAPDPDQIRTSDCFDLIRESSAEADRLLPRLLRELRNKGWETRSMFGQVTMRAEWPLKAKPQRSRRIGNGNSDTNG